MSEIWKSIPDYSGYYEASDKGMIRSVPRKFVRKIKILKQAVTPDGRLSVSLLKNGNSKTFLVHRLIGLTFISNPENKPQINHIDGNPKNNSLDNLEWSTRSENRLHAFRIGLQSHKGDSHNNRKLNSGQVKEIRKLRGKMKQREIAELYNVTTSTIGNILTNRLWSNI